MGKNLPILQDYYNIDSIMNWTYCQNNSDKILFEGISRLKKSKLCGGSEVDITTTGNYLIVNKGKYYYIGESKNIKSRLRQQFASKRSNFYKTYTEKIGGNLHVEDFKVRVIETSVGRKEMEEFGIVNFPTILNKFQLGKRNKVSFSEIEKIWDEIQSKRDKLLPQGERWFFKKPVINWFDADVPKVAGVYAVYNKTKALIYIGESSDVNERHITHSGRTYQSALRRHIGADILGFELIDSKTKKKRNFIEENDILVTEFLKRCSIRYATVSFGRYELEEYLIKKHNPILNRKDNKKNK